VFSVVWGDLAKCVAKRRKGETKEGGGKGVGNRESHTGNRADPEQGPTQNTVEAAKATQEHKPTGTKKENNHTRHKSEKARPPR
jgi:hypothetical protein